MTKPVGQQVVVVTGASSGVGRACAQAFGATGAKVALIARNEQALNNAAEEIRRAGGEAMVIPLDVASSDAVDGAAATVEQRWGRIDTWVNDAMTTVFSPAMQMQMEEYRRVTEVSYLGSVYGTMAALKRMVPRDEGTVIQICSALAYRSIPLQSAYCASKAAMRAFSDSVRTELLHDGSKVRLSVLILPAVNTPQFGHTRSRMPRHAQPVPPIYQPEVIARAAVYAAEHHVREMVVGWGSLKAVLGQKFIPGLLDHYLGKVGYKSQMTDQPKSPNQPENLFSPPPGDPGAHGMFDSKSKPRSIQLWLRMHESLLTLATATGTLAGVAATRDSGWLGKLAATDIGRKTGLAAAKQAVEHPRGFVRLLLSAVEASGASALPAEAAGTAARTAGALRDAASAAGNIRGDAGSGARRIFEDVRDALPFSR